MDGAENINNNLTQTTQGTKLIPGLALAKRKEGRVKEMAQKFSDSYGRQPNLLIIQVGSESSSSLYVSLKAKKARELGIAARIINFPELEKLDNIARQISSLDADVNVDGIMVQSPIPQMSLTDSLQIFNAIEAKKDVDGLTYHSLGRLWQYKSVNELAQALKNSELFISATPLGVLDTLFFIANDRSLNDSEIFELHELQKLQKLQDFLRGKKILIVNRSNIVGKPLAALFNIFNATVTIAHSATENLNDLLKTNEIIVTATGVDHMFTPEQFSRGQIVIDVGITNKNNDKTVKGDVRFSRDDKSRFANNDIAGPDWLSSVPGGVGPLTVVNLLYNTVLSAYNNTPKGPLV